jgi:hypothetical protein
MPWKSKRLEQISYKPFPVSNQKPQVPPVRIPVTAKALGRFIE